jgi:hypothetical protein
MQQNFMRWLVAAALAAAVAVALTTAAPADAASAGPSGVIDGAAT